MAFQDILFNFIFIEPLTTESKVLEEAFQYHNSLVADMTVKYLTMMTYVDNWQFRMLHHEQI